MDNNIWYLKDESIEDINEYFINIQKENIDIIDGKKSFSNIEKYIIGIFEKIINEKINFNNFYIECSLLPNSSNFIINYNNKQKKYSSKSILFNFEKETVPVIFTEIDMEKYKFKEFEDENKFKICYMKSNSIIENKNDNFFGVLKNDITISNQYYKILKIVLWEKEINNDEIINDNLKNYHFEDLIEKKVCNCIEDNFFENTIIDDIFYKKNYENSKNFTDIIEKNKNNCEILYLNINIKNNDITLNFLKNKYGILAEEIYPFSKINMDISIYNRFYRNKLCKNILSKDVCYWIINEYEKMIEKYNDENENIETMIDIENFPSILNFLFFITSLWFNKIKELFDIEKININIVKVYIKKYNNNNFYYNNIESNMFLNLNICLSNTCINNQGNIIFFDNLGYDIEDDTSNLEQSDLIISNSKKNIKISPIEEGNIYILTIITDIIY